MPIGMAKIKKIFSNFHDFCFERKRIEKKPICNIINRMAVMMTLRLMGVAPWYFLKYKKNIIILIAIAALTTQIGLILCARKCFIFGILPIFLFYHIFKDI